MEDDQITDELSGTIEKIDRCLERFEKLENELQQPWRNSDIAARKKTHAVINKLKDLKRMVRSGEIAFEQSELSLLAIDTMAMVIDLNLEHQDKQKSQDKKTAPLGSGD